MPKAKVERTKRAKRIRKGRSLTGLGPEWYEIWR